MTKTIQQLLSFVTNKTENWKIQLLQQWPNIIGDLSNRVTLKSVDKDILVLGVYDSSWLQELYILSPIILKMINASLDQPYIKQLRFKQVTKKKRKKMEISNQKLKPIQSRALTKKEMEALSKIEDEALRAALKKFLFRCQRERV
jgi:Dna[CI] antecedent, DciA